MIGGLLILPALMFGGGIAIAVAGGILSLLSALTSAAFSGSGLVIGIVIGLFAFCCFRSRNAADAEAKEKQGGKKHEEHD